MLLVGREKVGLIPGNQPRENDPCVDDWPEMKSCDVGNPSRWAFEQAIQLTVKPRGKAEDHDVRLITIGILRDIELFLRRSMLAPSSQSQELCMVLDPALETKNCATTA